MKLTLRLQDMARRALTLPRVLWTGAGMAVLAATIALGFTTLFSTLAAYDDEGYFLITIKGYLSGAKLYDQTAGQYGPFPFEFMAAVFKLFGLDVSNDTGRLITLGFWLGAALLLALAAYRLSRSPLLAFVVYVLAFRVLVLAPNEPMHPSHLLMLLLAAVIAITVFVTERKPRLAFALLGTLIAAALLSKVNIGVFAVASLVFAAVLASPRLSRIRVLVGAVSACFVLLPVALMGHDAVRSGYIVYSSHVLLGALAVAIVAIGTMRPRDPDSGAAFWLLYAFAGAVGATVVICGIVLAQGTSFSGLTHGVFLDALKQSNLLSWAPSFPANTFAHDAIGVAIAAAVALGALPRSRPWPTIGALARIGAGILILSAVFDPQPLALPIALLWVAAVPTGNDAPTPAARFVRLFVPALAVLQALHAYPVAGSQVRWSTFLFIMVGAVCISDGLSELGVSALGLRGASQRLATAGALGVVIWVGLTGLVLPLRDSSQIYHAATPVNVWGATRIRVSPAMAQEYESLVHAVRNRCNTFVTMPGFGSLYLMSQKTPPTWMNISAWVFAWDASEQQRVVDQIEGVPRLCAIRSTAVENMWSGSRPIPDGPLRTFILNDFRRVGTYGNFELMVRRPQ